MTTFRCRCESSLCDHDGTCVRPAYPKLTMAYVRHTCVQCASNMVATGGQEYIDLTFGCDYCPATISRVEHEEGGLCVACREAN